MMILTEEQQAYIKTPLNENVYLRACPGSGKTEVVAARITQAIRNWTQFPSGIAVLTFSNSATDELKERLVEYLGEPVSHPHCVSTFDSFLFTHIVAKIASQITGYQGKDGDFRIRLLDRSADIFRTKTKICERKISACRYDYDLDSNSFVFSTGELTDVVLNAAVLSDENKQDLIDTKKRLWRSGFATYRDIDIARPQGA
ncbi:TPA: UvrD-helicase domain-containing protein [Serratia fonticola]